MTVPNVRYYESLLLYRASCLLLKTMRRRVSALLEVFGSVVQILGFGPFWNTKKWSVNGRFQHPSALHHFLQTTIRHQPGGVASF